MSEFKKDGKASFLRTASSSEETVKHFLSSSVKALLLWWLPPFDPLI
jgi:hypothetical protein